MIAWLYWDPPKDIFTIPFIDRPVAWYGLLFVIGLICAYWINYYIFKKNLTTIQHLSPQEASDLSLKLTDRLIWFSLVGTIIGARLGHVFFYDWPKYQYHPLDIIKIWEGGLASHGGAIGILIALGFYLRSVRKLYPGLTFIKLLDVYTIYVPLVGFFIRIGNFVNQEIIGSPTQVPWAVIFGHPIDGSAPVPRHPTQLYEAFAYLAIFVFLFLLWKYKGSSLRPGIISGLFFILVFGFRFAIEFLKNPMSEVIDESFLQMGQYLSIPFILLGIILLCCRCKNCNKTQLN